MDENSNPQANAAPPVATGPTVAELQAQLEEIKKQSEGRLRDLQQERDKRQELQQAQLAAASPAVTPAPGVTDDELGKVLKPYIEPTLKAVAEMQKERAAEKAQQEENQALSYLASQTKTTVEEVLKNKDLQDKLIGVARKWNLVGDSYTVSKRAYELMELENLKTKEDERVRNASAARSASLPTGTGSSVSTSSAKQYSAEEFNKLPAKLFGDMADKGHFRKLPDGSFDYTPR